MRDGRGHALGARAIPRRGQEVVRPRARARLARLLAARILCPLGVSAIAAASGILVAAPANAAETDSAVLVCGSTEVTVTGFGRGQVLFVAGSTQRFIVTFAQLAGGPVLFEAPGHNDSDRVVTCTTTSPVTSRSFVFRGFFTRQP